MQVDDDEPARDALPPPGAGGLRASTRGAPLCYASRFAVREVDATGAPLAGGFGCLWLPLTFPPTCETQRYAPGTTVRLEAYGGRRPG